MLSARRTGHLHRNRFSASGETYFVTCCTAPRKPVLHHQATAEKLIAVAQEFHGRGDATIIASTVMSDHIHWLMELGPRLSLGRLLAKMKSLTRSALSQLDAEWQRDFYERRLRTLEEREDYAFYIFMNPHRSGLVEKGQAWPLWWTGVPETLRFTSHLDDQGRSPVEWLDLPVPERVLHGE